MFESLNWADYAILGIVIVSTLLSLSRGFVREALSLLMWILGFWVALNYCSELSEHFINHIETPSLRIGLSFVILFIGVLLIGSFINYLLGQAIKKTGLSGTDRLLGMIFGLARGVLLVALLMLLASFTKLPEDPWWQESKLIPHFQDTTDWLKSGSLPQYISDQFVVSPPDVLEAAGLTSSSNSDKKETQQSN